jgi:hypothetical protein
VPQRTENGKFIDALREVLDLAPLYRSKNSRSELERFYVMEYATSQDGLKRREDGIRF